MHRRGASVGDYQAPLFLAWQLTNRCQSRCLHCCEESGPDKAWASELSRDEALDLARQAVALKIPYAAFGGGEPLGAPHVWEVFKTLSAGGTGLKIETNGLYIDDAAADRLQRLDTECVQISVDGATAAIHEKVRPLGNFDGAVAAARRLTRRKLPTEIVFVPTRLNLQDIVDTYDLAVDIGARAFITGPMMRLGRAAASWKDLAPTEKEWKKAVEKLEKRAAKVSAGAIACRLCVYPWDILTEMKTRLKNPQAMVLVVPDGKVKLLNALPFACADLRKETLAQAWIGYRKAWASAEVRDFISACQKDSALLRHANKTWPMGSWTKERRSVSIRH